MRGCPEKVQHLPFGYVLILIVILLSAAVSASSPVIPGNASYRPYQAPIIPPGMGNLTINSDPPGARVYVDGEYRGVTPVTFFEPAGSHTVVMNLEGYRSTSATLTLESQSTHAYGAFLVRITGETEKGPVRVQSYPSGGQVYIDGEYIGTAPINRECPVGSHTLRVTMDGYQDYTTTFTVVRGGGIGIDAPLRQLPIPAPVTIPPRSGAGMDVGPYPLSTVTPRWAPAGTLDVTSIHIASSPEGAHVYLNSQPRGTTPLSISGIPPGHYQLRITEPGYRNHTEEITIPKDHLVFVSAELVRKPRPIPGFEAPLAMLALPVLFAVFRKGKEVGLPLTSSQR